MAMILDDWREWLYPLGFLAPIAFGSRVLVQWLTSEIKRKSTVTPAFWKISLIGNCSLWIHATCQLQFHVALIQACNAVISWRNLALIQGKASTSTFKKNIFLFSLSISATFASFILQYSLSNEHVWFRIPQVPWREHSDVQLPFLWHVLGMLGLVLFNSRFWIQWIHAEKHKTSTLNSTFWWISLVGDSLCLIYFLRIRDPVNLLGPVLGLIPYVRNLMLLYQTKQRYT